MAAARIGCVVALLCALSAMLGCTAQGPESPAGPSTGDLRLIEDYFHRANLAADEGASQQRRFLRETQHPDFRGGGCSLDGMTVKLDPALRSVRTDTDWVPAGATDPPRGAVYLVAVRVTVLTDRTEVGEQIGTQHVVVLDDTAYGFAPCPM